MARTVRAKAAGFCGSYREAGDQFELPEGVPLGRWMEPVGWEPGADEGKPKGKPKKAEPGADEGKPKG